MKLLKNSRETALFLSLLRERTSGAGRIEGTVKKVLSEVRTKGDRAVLKYTEKFDFLKIRSIRISSAEIARYAGKADRKILKSLETAAKRIRAFHEMQREESWSFSEDETVLGQIVRPLERIGVYVPGGKASYPSTVLMNVIPAQVAGVDEIALCVPTPKNEINPSVMAAIMMLGVTEVYRIGGAQAIGAMAYGTRTMRRVDKIVGPGNIYVATAKRLVFGEVDIDMIAGPSEVLVIADETADPVFTAADLLSQAEHDERAAAILVTDSLPFAKAVKEEIEHQLSGLERKGIAESSLESYGAIIVAKDLKHAAGLANEVAPEHLEVMTRNPFDLLPMIRNAGAIFLGPWTPEPLGDYVAGPNHTLPTGGTARFFSPLGVYDFVKRSSLLSFSKAGFMKLAKTVETLSESEGLSAHGNTIKVRLDRR
ncbi:MAG TPA: histidinol dehydrogenase [Thermodesulfovibrionales bacterium]|nr:histidinol dehydrogenase [Thermodesulfovibrionales bacterium]